MSEQDALSLEALLTLEGVKQHLKIDFDDDDELLKVYMPAAEKAVLQYCNIEAVPDAQASVFMVAALLVVEDLYDDREDKRSGIPTAAAKLIDPYRVMRV